MKIIKMGLGFLFYLYVLTLVGITQGPWLIALSLGWFLRKTIELCKKAMLGGEVRW